MIASSNLLAGVPPAVSVCPPRRVLRICHVNTYDKVGGAARSAFRLHAGLQRIGHDSSMFVRSAKDTDPAVHQFKPAVDLAARVQRRWRRTLMRRDLAKHPSAKPPGAEHVQDCRSEFAAEIVRQLPFSDVVNLHWIAGAFVDYPTFFASIPADRPVVWTLHDMNAFTGGCHYDEGCGRFLSACGHCPQLAFPSRSDFSAEIWARKHRAFARLDPERLQIVTPSRWLADEARRSSLLGRFPVTVIPYGLDLQDFAPRERSHVRRLMGIPEHAKVLLFVSDGVTNVRKGFRFLIEALRELEGVDHLVLVSVGHNKPPLNVSVPWIHVNAIDNDRFMSAIYSAADVFAIPSLQDNLPNTALEALACGTPVVGFDVGGIPDLVRPGETGLLVPRGDVAALARAIAGLLGSPDRLRQMAARCRQIAEREYSLECQASRYAALYEKLLSAA